MPDFWSVPLNNAGINDLNSQIANSGAKFDFLSQLPEQYEKGKELKYQQNQRDIFKNGLPRVGNDPNGPIDWNTVSEQLAKVGGAGATQNIINLQNLQGMNDFTDALRKSGVFGPVTQSQAPSTTQFPPSASRTIQAPTQQPTTSADVATGDKAPPGRNLTSGEITGISYGPATGGVTAREIAARIGGDAGAIASMLGVSPDEVINPADPQVRAALVNAARSNTPQQVAQAQTAQPQTFDSRFSPATTPGQPYAAPPASGFTEATAAAYETRAQQLNAAATVAARYGNAAMAQRLGSAAEQAMKQAEIIRQTLGKNAELPNEQKNANASGFSNPREYANATEGDKLDQESFNKRYPGIQALGESAVNGAQKAQLLKNLTLQPGFYSGPFSENIKAFQQFKSIFGQDPSSALPAEAFNKVVNDMLIEQVRSLGQSGVGRVLMAEVQSMKQAIASLGITPQTNRALAEIVNRVYQQQGDIADLARNVKAPPGQLSRTLDAKISEYYKSHPLFNQQELQHPQLLGAPDAPPQSAQWNVQQKRQWAQSVGLKPGDPIRFGGQIVSVP